MISIPAGEVRTSPFLQRARSAAGEIANEVVTGRAYLLGAEEYRLLAVCAEGRPLAAFSLAEQRVAKRLLDRLLLLDDAALTRIGRMALGELDLEVAGSCNAECIFCPREELRHGRGLGVMKRDTFARTLALFAPYLRFVGFAGIGEPTLNKALPEFVAALGAQGIETALVTNGSLLSDELSDALLAGGLRSVQVSFNGNDPASYEEHMVGLDHHETKARLERFLARVAGRIPVYVSAVETSQNSQALVGFVEYWKARGAQAGIVPCHSRGGTIVQLSPRPPAPAKAETPRCGLFATRCFVSWDGEVLACCHDVDGQTRLGNVAELDATTLIARKLEVMRRGDWYPVCHGCDEPARLRRPAPELLRA